MVCFYYLTVVLQLKNKLINLDELQNSLPIHLISSFTFPDISYLFIFYYSLVYIRIVFFCILKARFLYGPGRQKITSFSLLTLKLNSDF